MPSPIRSIKTRVKRAGWWFVKNYLDEVAFVIAKSVPDEEAYRAFSEQGFHLLRKHYYLPIPEEGDLDNVKEPTDLVGVDIDEDEVFKTLETAILPYKAEFNAFPVEKSDDPAQFYLVNGTFMAIDGNVYYGLIRHHAPRRIIEIGSGNSTLLASAAIRQNVAEGKHASQLISIEPYPPPALRQDIPEITELIEKPVQQVELDVFTSLEAGDILFIDSTHVLRTGGDVWWEYCEILPRLKPGVLVHIHDISLPQPYPRVYFDQRLYWNEQYVLQAFMTYNSRFEVLWPGNYMMNKHPQRMQQAFSPEYQHMRDVYPSSEPTSFWIRSR